jgi:hypothetical protein
MKIYPPKQTALEAYEEHQARIQGLIKQISAGIEAHDKKCHPRHNWGHVGDLASIEETLRDISDRLHSEGEYAS